MFVKSASSRPQSGRYLRVSSPSRDGFENSSKWEIIFLKSSPVGSAFTVLSAHSHQKQTTTRSHTNDWVLKHSHSIELVMHSTKRHAHVCEGACRVMSTLAISSDSSPPGRDFNSNPRNAVTVVHPRPVDRRLGELKPSQ